MTEEHPFEPFLPDGARLLMLGTFPPSVKRWSMRFYYPNFMNDMWRIVGLCFYGNKDFFVDNQLKRFRLDELVPFLCQKGIALYDTCTKVIRTKNTASDKDLQVVETTDIAGILERLPYCRAIVTAGQLATTLCCQQLGVVEPRVGDCSEAVLADGRAVRLYRMPSSSRAYPLSLEKKAEYYKKVFDLI